MPFTRTWAMLVLVLACALGAWAVDGWQLLRSGKSAEAQAAFQATLQTSPADTRALLGLALLQDAEDDPLAAAQSWQRLLQSAPQSPLAAVGWSRLVARAQELGRFDLLDATARTLEASKATLPPLRASARLACAAAHERAGQYPAAEALYARMGYLRKWRVIGPFDNVSLSGFTKAFPPEEAIDFTKAYPGVNGHPRAWLPLSLVARDGRCEVGLALGDEQESIFYAVTAIKVARAQDVLLCLDPSGASKLWVNGRPVAEDALYRVPQELTADPYRIPARLEAGWNTLLVKLVSDEQTLASFRLRVTTPGGEDLPPVAIDPAQAKSPAQAVDSTLVPPSTHALIRPLQALPASVEQALLLGTLQCDICDYEASAETLRKALVQWPEVGLLHWALSQTLTEDAQFDEGKAERELAYSKDPRIVEAALAELQEEEEAMEAGEFLQQLKQLKQRFPRSPAVRWALAEHLVFTEELKEDGLKAAREAVQLAPGPAAHLCLISFYEYESSTTEMQKALTTALQVFPHHAGLLEAKFVSLLDLGKTAAAIALCPQLLQAAPATPYYRSRLADAFIREKKLAEALTTLQVLRQQCPHDADVCERMGNVLREMGKTPDAVTQYRNALRLDPSRGNLREKLLVLTREKSVLSRVPVTPVEPILAEAVKMKPLPGAPAIILLDEARQVVHPDFASELRVHTIIKVFDNAGVELFQSLSIYGASPNSDTTIEKARLLKADGKIQDVSDELWGGEASFPSLAPGDTIDLAYRVTDYQEGALARHFWTDWSFDAIHTPIRLSRFVLMLPEGVNITQQAHGTVPDATVRTEDGWAIREWVARDVPPLPVANGAPAVQDYGSWIDLSTIQDWGEIVRWYTDLATPRCQPDAAIRAKAAELTKGATTEDEKIRRITAFVAREIRYQSMPFRLSQYVPTKGRQVLREAYGDCKDKAALLVALLAAVDVKAEMVLVNGRSVGITPCLPSPRFTHAINRIHTAQGTVWIDATAEQMAFGTLPSEDQLVPALVISPETSALATTPAPPAESDPSTTEVTASLDAAGKLTAQAKMCFRRSFGWFLRSTLTQIAESRHEQILANVTSNLARNATFDDGTIEQLTDVEQPLVMRVQFHAEQYATSAGDFMLVQLPWKSGSNLRSMIISDADRSVDLEIGMYYGMQMADARLTLPAGWTLKDVPETMEQTTKWGRCRVQYRLDGQTLIAHSELLITTLRIPAAEYQPFRAFIKAYTTESARQLVLVKQ